MSNKHFHEEQAHQKAYAEIIKDLAAAVASSIPPASFVIATAEVAKAAWDLHEAKTNHEALEAKFQLLMGIICVIPGIGGGFRLAFKSLFKNPQYYGPVMFDIVVAILEEANRHLTKKVPLNPEGYLKLMIDVPKLQNYLNQIRIKAVGELNQHALMRWAGAPKALDTFLKSLSSQLSMIIAEVLAPLVRIAIERSLLRRKNSARTSNVPNKTKTSNNKPKDKSAPTVTKSRGSLTARIKSKFQDTNMTFVIGGVGEHIADYYCLEKLGWGKEHWDGHDKGTQGIWTQQPSSLHLGKLNDGKKLNKNSPISNDIGIDGLWRADPKNNCGKKYAIIEVKATTGVARVTNKYVASKLGVLSEKHKGKPVIQMDHYWIGTRIKKLIKKLPDSVQDGFIGIHDPEHFSKLYTRHIIVVSLLVEPGLSHIDALLDDKKSDAADPDHAIHNGIVVHKYGESTIDNIIQEKHRRLKNKANKKKPN
ncbi:hypothetical protein BGI36_07175 [Snodgrassella communis]|uniref:hypothetical protein n=1 Tax=Snodgrassella communis TaxID=2946699 RepID=UPI000C1EFD36|nr:hypothetical protein [Snodgrassella communis]PIT21062.1 hypothetical protein BGI36_07175 [Snodgrassella communis]